MAIIGNLQCKICGKGMKEFPSRIKIGRGKFCSKGCYYKSITGNKRGTSPLKGRKFKIYKKICKVCGKDYKKKNGVSIKQWNNSTTCSLKCFNGQRLGIKLSEEQKNKISLGNMGRIVTKETREKISKKNAGQKRPSATGENNYKWIKERTKILENHRIRGSLENKLWIKACMIRDDFTCQKTGKRGGRLVVHHINNFNDFPELRFALDNGITLSIESHIEFHKKYGVKNNTMEQLKEFLSK